MLTREQVRDRVMKVLTKLLESGITSAEIAFRMKVHWSTVNNWIKGHKVPHVHTISLLEQVFRVKVFE